jgi:hypothetical protein
MEQSGNGNTGGSDAWAHDWSAGTGAMRLPSGDGMAGPHVLLQLACAVEALHALEPSRHLAAVRSLVDVCFLDVFLETILVGRARTTVLADVSPSFSSALSRTFGLTGRRLRKRSEKEDMGFTIICCRGETRVPMPPSRSERRRGLCNEGKQG